MKATLVRHEGHGPAHLDLFIETEPAQALVTYELAVVDWARLQAGETVQALRKADHRNRYLDYEGPVSDNRGTVVSLWRGDCEAAEDWRTELGFRFEDGMLKAVATDQP